MHEPAVLLEVMQNIGGGLRIRRENTRAKHIIRS